MGANAAKLGIYIREQASLQQRIVREVDAGHHVAGMKRHLLGLGKIVVGVAVQRQPADAPNRNKFLRNDLGRVEQVKIEIELVPFLDDLETELPLRIVAALNRLEEVATMEIGVFAGDLLGLVPD